MATVFISWFPTNTLPMVFVDVTNNTFQEREAKHFDVDGSLHNWQYSPKRILVGRPNSTFLLSVIACEANNQHTFYNHLRIWLFSLIVLQRQQRVFFHFDIILFCKVQKKRLQTNDKKLISIIDATCSSSTLINQWISIYFMSMLTSTTVRPLNSHDYWYMETSSFIKHLSRFCFWGMKEFVDVFDKKRINAFLADVRQ